MIDKEKILLQLNVYKLITEYQIREISTSYDTSGLNYMLITKNFPMIGKEDAVNMLNYWLQYELNRGIAVYSKARFNTDSNVETVLKLRQVLAELDNKINTISQVIANENIEKDNRSEEIQTQNFEIEKTDNGVIITFFNPSWFKKNNVVNLTFDEARELYEKLKAIL